MEIIYDRYNRSGNDKNVCDRAIARQHSPQNTWLNAISPPKCFQLRHGYPLGSGTIVVLFLTQTSGTPEIIKR